MERVFDTHLQPELHDHVGVRNLSNNTNTNSPTQIYSSREDGLSNLKKIISL